MGFKAEHWTFLNSTSEWHVKHSSLSLQWLNISDFAMPSNIGNFQLEASNQGLVAEYGIYREVQEYSLRDAVTAGMSAWSMAFHVLSFVFPIVTIDAVMHTPLPRKRVIFHESQPQEPQEQPMRSCRAP